MDNSEWSGRPLPDIWVRARPHVKHMLIDYLQNRGPVPPWWNTLDWTDRKEVVLHLCAVGSVSYNHARVRILAGKEALYATLKADKSKIAVRFETTPIAGCGSDKLLRDQYRARHPEVIKAWERAGMLYPKPNDGKRILPSIYTRLKDAWLRASGVYQVPAKMNQGHLRNTVALLNESHVNLVDRMCDVLGRMHNHLHNRPDLQAKIVDLFHDLEILQVDELYPIIELLASYIQPEVEFDPRDLDDSRWLQEF